MYEIIDQNGVRHGGLYAREYDAKSRAKINRNPHLHLSVRKVEGEPTETRNRSHRANAKPGNK